jgi:hypothetical protein
MPRTTTTPITPRQPIDSSRSANVALPVVASQGDVAGYGSAMFGVARALNGLAGSVGDVAEIRRRAAARQKEEQDRYDAEQGKEAAAKRAVTGEVPDLQGFSDAYVQSYQQTDGLRTAGEFENQLLPKLSRLEPGQDVDKFIQDEAGKYAESTGMPEETSRTFMAAVAHQQDGWKQQYLKQSIAESLKRDEESLASVAVDQFQKGILTTPEGLQSFRQLVAHKGMTEDEGNALLVKAAVAAMADGKTDVEKVRGALSGIKVGTDGGSLIDVPEYKQDLDLAAKRGLSIQDEERKKAQEGALTRDYMHASDKADQGILSDPAIEAMRAKYDLSPEWAVGMHNRNREAQEKAAKQYAVNDIKRQARQLAYTGSALEIEAFGRRYVEEASGELLHEAVQTGDLNNVKRLAVAMSQNGTPWPAMKSVLDSINTADSKRATQLAQLYETVASVSPDYANKLVGSDTKAKLDRYIRETRSYGADPAQAWEKVRNAEVIAPEILSKQMGQVWTARKADLPTDFDDTSRFNPFTRDTKIQNQAQVQSEVYRLTRELLSTGQYADEPAKAFDAAWEKYKANHIRVGNQYVPTFGTTEHVEPQTAQAMTDYSAAFKEKLVANGQLDAEDEVWFRPDPNSPGKWTAFEMVGGVPFPMTKDGALVQVNPNAVRADHAVWKDIEDRKQKTLRQGLNKLGISDLSGDDEPTLRAYAKKLSYKPEELTGVTGMTFDGKVIASGRTHYKQDAEQLNSLLDETKAQGFIDFIHSTTR